MSRSSSSRPIAIRKRIVVSRSVYRARRSSGVSFGLAGALAVVGQGASSCGPAVVAVANVIPGQGDGSRAGLRLGQAILLIVADAATP